MTHPLCFIVLGIALTITLGNCGNNLVSDSSTGDCTSYLSSRDYDSALTTCTSYKDKASAYMGKAGYDYINLLDNSGSTPTVGTDSESFGADDIGTDTGGATFFKILKLTYEDINDATARKTAVQSALTNLGSAITQLKPVYSSDKDAATNYAIANLLALKLDESIQLDSAGAASCVDSNSTAATSEFSCTGHSSSPGSTNPAFRKNDGFLQKGEKRKAFDAACGTFTAGSPSSCSSDVCSPFTNSITYLSQAADGFTYGSFGSSSVSSLMNTAGQATCQAIKCLSEAGLCDINNYSACKSGGKFEASCS
ncbi:MAG: hypothetical protein CL911_05115 [Deltaproteobacteria bacterium]|nr:hypothetical protein [Deltaproteobacteria bacterium]MDP7630946.1 hypothetical protein [SAR324 cluster bacterium]